MFGEYAQIASYLQPAREGALQNDSYYQDALPAYLRPTYQPPQAWAYGKAKSGLTEDFIMVAEFSELEGPKPLMTIPKDGGANFDQNAFSVRILAVDHQNSSEGFSISEDAQVVLSDVETGVFAFVHHLQLFDNTARGFVRPYCIAYITTDQRKLMYFYEELSWQFKKVARYLKYGNRILFVGDLERHLKDLEHTKVFLLNQVSKIRLRDPEGLSGQSQESRKNAENELYRGLQTIRQSSTEIKDILSILKPLLTDKRLEARFRQLEDRAFQGNSHSGQDKLSLQENWFNDLSSLDELDMRCGSLTEPRMSPLALFKPRDYKPLLVETKKAKRFNAPLRGLHELCSWGAKEGLKKLRHIHEYFKRELAILELEKNESRLFRPGCASISHGQCITGNFLSGVQMKRSQDVAEDAEEEWSMFRNHQWGSVGSLDSLDSFKSAGSCMSFLGPHNASVSSYQTYDSQSGYGFRSASSSPVREISLLMENEYYPGLEKSVEEDTSDSEPKTVFYLPDVAGTKQEDTMIKTCSENNDEFQEGNNSVQEDITDDGVNVLDKNESDLGTNGSEIKGQTHGVNIKSNLSFFSIYSPSEPNADEENWEPDINLSVNEHLCEFQGTDSEDTVWSKAKEGRSASLNSTGSSQTLDALTDKNEETDKQNGKMCQRNQQSKNKSSDVTACGNMNCCNHGATHQPSRVGNLHENNGDALNSTVANPMPFLMSNAARSLSESIEINQRDSSHIFRETQNKTEPPSCDEKPCSVSASGRTELNSDTDKDKDGKGITTVTTQNCKRDSKLSALLELDDSQEKDTGINTQLTSLPDMMSEQSPTSASSRSSSTKAFPSVSKTENQVLAAGDLGAATLGGCRRNNSTSKLSSSTGANQPAYTHQITSHSRPRITKVNQSGTPDEDNSMRYRTESDASSAFTEVSVRELFPHLVGTDGSPSSKDNLLSCESCEGCEATLYNDDFVDIPNPVSSGTWKPRGGVYTLGDWINNLSTGRPGFCLCEVLSSYHNLQHVIFSLLSGRPVLIAGASKFEPEVIRVVNALAVFVPTARRRRHAVLEWTSKPLRISDLTKLKLVGICRPERRTLDSFIPSAIKKACTIVDVERKAIVAPPYQGQFITQLLAKRKVLKSDVQLLSYIGWWLMDILAKAFIFFHSFCLSSAGSILYSHSPKDQRDTYCTTVAGIMTRIGVKDSDCEIIEYLTEMVKLSRLEPNVWQGVDSGSIVYPLTLQHRICQTFRC